MREKQIKGLNLDEITEICVANGFTPFRAKQIFHWMYRHGVTDIEEMNNIPDKIKNFISENFIFSTLEIDKIQESSIEDTKKFLFKTHDNLLIESVSMIDKNLHTVCISSQVGCNVVTNPGVIIGRGSNIWPNVTVSGAHPADSTIKE